MESEALEKFAAAIRGRPTTYEERVRKRMARIDAMPKDVRAVVHEWGLTIVDAMIDCGVKNPRHMQHLIKTVLQEARGIGGVDGRVSGSRQIGPGASHRGGA